MKRLAVFASGSGSNFQAIVENAVNYQVVLLVCDKIDAFVIKRAHELAIPTLIINPKDYQSKVQYEEVILNSLKEHQVEFIALAGYMRLIGSVLLTAFKDKIINIHPSLLPAFKGKNAIEQVINAGVLETGVTIHFVDSGIDTGEIIAQDIIKINEKMSKNEIEEKIHLVEHRLYPKILNQLLEEDLK